MKHKLNLTSMLIGAIFGVVASLTIAATTSHTQTCGRFQLLATDSVVFKIDTSTGQVWRSFVNNPSSDFMKPNVPAPESEK